MDDPFYECTSIWINDNDDNEYYSNKFLVCKHCRSTIHIISLNLEDNRLITYHCNCGRKEKQLDYFLEENVHFLKKTSYISGNFFFRNEKYKTSFTLNKIIPDCEHGRKSISFCHVCSEYLCDICLKEHKAHLIYKENLVTFPRIEYYQDFMDSLSINYQILSNQLDALSTQLFDEREEMEKNYNNNIEGNKLLLDLFEILHNNYRLTRSEGNFVNCINFYNFSHPNEKYKIRQRLSPQNIHFELKKFSEYCKYNYFLTLDHQKKNQLTFLQTIVEYKKEESLDYQEEEDKPKKKSLKKKSKLRKMKQINENDIWYDELIDAHNGNSKEDIDEYELYYELNIQLLDKEEQKKLSKQIKYDTLDSNCIQKIENNTNIRIKKCFVLPDNRLAILYHSHNPIIDVFSFMNFKNELTISLNNEKAEQFYFLTEGTIIYYYGNIIKRLVINNSTYSIEESYFEDSNITDIVELSKQKLLIGTKNNFLYIINNSFPFQTNTIIKRYYCYICGISDNLILISSNIENSFIGSYVLNIKQNTEIKKYQKLTFISSYKLDTQKKVILDTSVDLIIFNTLTLESETRIDLRVHILSLFTESDNENYIYIVNDKRQLLQINFITFEYHNCKFSPEQGKINYCLPLPCKRILIETNKKIKIFGY